MLRKRQKRDSNAVINCLYIKPEAKLRLKIPLSASSFATRTPINEVDMQQLKNELVTSYSNSDQVLYVSMYNDDKAKSLDVSSDISDLWSGL